MSKPLRIRVCRDKQGFYLEQKGRVFWHRMDWQVLRKFAGFEIMPEVFAMERNAEAAAKALLKADLASRATNGPAVREITYVWGEEEQR